MSTFTAILEPAADGTLHVPVPEEWRSLPIRIRAELEPAEAEGTAKLRGFGALKGKLSMTPDFDAPLEDFKDYME